MKISQRIAMILFLSGLLMVLCKAPVEHRAKTGGAEVVSFRALSFDLSDVKLLDGPFRHATQLNVESLLNYEPDRLLAAHRREDR